MPLFNLTPAAIANLNQFLLCFFVLVYLVWRWFRVRTRGAHQLELWLLLLIFLTTVFSLLLFLDASLRPMESLLAAIAQPPTQALLMLALVQFSYHFPRPEPGQRVERQILLGLGLVYAVFEIALAAWCYGMLAGGTVERRETVLRAIPVAFILWVVVLFVRGAFRNWHDSSMRRFTWIFLIPFLMTIVNLLRNFNLVSEPAYQSAISVGTLITLFLFILNYLNSQPVNTPLMVKAAGAMLTASLAVTGTLPWLLAPAYAARYFPAISDHRTLLFTPNTQGGYDIRETEFHFDSDLGEKWIHPYEEWTDSQPSAAFDFPFYGQTASRIYISNCGALGVGNPLDHHNFPAGFTNSPAIFPLLVDLSPNDNPKGGIYVRQEADLLLVTYSHLVAYYHPDLEYTFQVALHADGSFELTYNGLPQLQYYPNDHPEATGWVIGAKPALAPADSLDLSRLPLSSGVEGALQNEYGSFRGYLHAFLLPLAYATLISALFFVILLPLAIYFGLGRPLARLLRGVQRFNEGDWRTRVPVAFNDEVGYLTESFNRMGDELHGMIRTLEERVEERTKELQESEQHYRDLFEMESDAIFIIRNADGRILEANQAAETLYGYTREELVQLCNTDVSAEPEDTRKATHSPAETSQIIHIPLRWHRKKDGTVFPIEITARFFAFHGESVHIAAIRDISARIQAEESRRRIELRYHSLFEQTHDAVFIMDLEGRLLETNRRAAELLGYPGEELARLTIRDISAEVEQSQDMFTRVRNGEHVPVYERRFLRKDGSQVPVEIHLELVRDEEGHPQHMQSVARDITLRKQTEAELERLAITDPLTGMYNRRHFFNEAEKLFMRSNHPPFALSAMMLDIDRFKLINDTYGHQVGDVVLKEVARRMEESMRPTDLLARTGGEEFLVLLPRTTLNDAREIARRLTETIRRPVSLGGLDVSVSISVGIAGLHAGVESLDELLRRADQAMYAAKTTGGDRWVVWQNAQ